MSSLSSESICAIVCAGAAGLPYLYAYLPSNIVAFLNISSMATTFGTQVWVGSIAGLTMFRTLKRRTFGLVQSKLFPKFALLNTTCSLLAITTFINLKNYDVNQMQELWRQPEGKILIIGLISNFLNSFFFIGGTTDAMFQIHKREKELGLPDEVGATSQIKKCEKATPEDRKLLRKFGMLHGMSMMMSLASVGAAAAYLYHIGKAIKF